MASSSSTTALDAAQESPPTQPLTRDNFLVWKALVTLALRGSRVLSLVGGSDATPEETLEVEDANQKKTTMENPAYAAWIARDQQVLRFLLNSLSPNMLAHVVGLEISAEVWAAITTMFCAPSRSRTRQLRSILNDMKKGDLMAPKYFAKMKALASELAATRKPIDDDELVGYLLHGLDSSYNPLVADVNANPSTSLSYFFSQLEAFDDR
jgi:hypothetical protein